MSFDYETLTIGQIVLYSSAKGHPYVAFLQITHIGLESIGGLVYAYNGDTTVAKHVGNVKHDSDPIWADAARVGNMVDDGDFGCFMLHPDTVRLRDLESRVANLEGGEAKPAKKEQITFPAVKRDPSLTSFREPKVESAPELTDEQKAARAAALEAARS